MSIGVGSGSDRGVASGCDEVRVVVVAVGKVGTLAQKKIPAIPGFELGAITIEEVSAKLIEDKNHNQFRFAIVGVGSRSCTEQGRH
jgi:hypothetical protein